MADLVLTPVSHLVLGVIARRGSATPYELKAAVAESIGHFWSFPHAQLYKEPPRLAEAGLLVEEREETGRRRRVFRITDAGRAALAEWLAAPETGRTELRDPGLLKLAFMDLGRPEDVRRLARAQAEAHRAHLAVYRSLAELPADAMSWSLRRTLNLGLAYEEDAVRFWQELADQDPVDLHPADRKPADREPADRASADQASADQDQADGE